MGWTSHSSALTATASAQHHFLRLNYIFASNLANVRAPQPFLHSFLKFRSNMISNTCWTCQTLHK